MENQEGKKKGEQQEKAKIEKEKEEEKWKNEGEEMMTTGCNMIGIIRKNESKDYGRIEEPTWQLRLHYVQGQKDSRKKTFIQGDE